MQEATQLMLWLFVLIAVASSGTLFWWVFLRLTKVRIPAALAGLAESEPFLDWLSANSDWLIWSRDLNGDHYLMTWGSVRARRFRKLWLTR